LSSVLACFKTLYRLPAASASALACFLYARATGDRRAVRLWARFASRVCGRQLVIRGAAPDARARLIIANHVSYLDLLPIFALWPDCHPVAMREILSWPLVGRLVRDSAIFVDETDPESRRDARAAMREAWRSGRRVLVFPEGIIARRRGRFRAGCFEEATRAGIWIQGARLTYPPELLAGLDGRLFEERFFWVLSRSFSIEAEVFPAEPARGDPEALAARWQARLLGAPPAPAAGSFSRVSSPC
jgi:1-acyl-sn-glycerol-3-phosphate acyltransferase